MKVSYISDLHLEFGPTPKLPGGDILLIAGDTIPAVRLSNNSHLLEKFQSLIIETRKYQITYMVMGNHEHYHGDYYTTRELFENHITERIILLDNELDEIVPGLRIYGATFWTDYGNFCNKNLDTARTSMNDHYCISENGSKRFRPETAYDINKICRKDLERYVEEFPNEKFIVMTHHTPSLSCGHKKWGGADNRLNYSFHNTYMDDFIKTHPNIVHWVCGHTHDSFEGKIGDCQIHINPRGYVSSNGFPENSNFDPNLYFEVNI